MKRQCLDEAAPPVCKLCGSQYVERGYATPLCQPCRTNLVRRPIPIGIIALSVLAGILFIVSFSLFPASLTAAVNYARGQRADAAKNYPAAAGYYRRVVAVFPDSTESLAQLGLAEYHAGDLNAAVRDFRLIGGRQIDSKELADQVNAAVAQLSNGAADPQPPQTDN